MHNTNNYDATKANDLGDFLGLFNYPMQQPQMYAQQMPAGQAPQGVQPQGMVQLGTVPQQQQEQVPQQNVIPLQAPVQQPMVTPQSLLPQQVQPVAPQVPAGSVATPPVVDLNMQAVVAQNEAYRLQIAQNEATQTQLAEQQQQDAINKMKPQEKQDAKLDLIYQQTKIATDRANQYHVAYQRERLLNEHNQELDPMKLDTSSVEALNASIPIARQSYLDFENTVARKLTQRYGMEQHAFVEGLPPAPMTGLPSSNHAGSIPQGPAGAQAPYTQHPQLARDNVTQYTPNPAYGRVYQPQPGALPQPALPAPGQTYFQPTYQQPAHAPQQQYASPPVQLVPAAQMQQTDGNALESARQAIMAVRKGGSNRLRAMGLQESSQTAMANSSAGGAQLQHTAMPDPAQFAGAGGQLHPMHLAR